MRSATSTGPSSSAIKSSRWAWRTTWPTRCEKAGAGRWRVAIARALATDPPLLLLDEPTASLDPTRRGELGETPRALAGSGRTLVVTTHDDDFARDFSDRVVILAEGQVVEEGDPRQVLINPQHPATQALLQTKERRITPSRLGP